MHTLKAVLLGCSVLVLEADVSQYRIYSDSLCNMKTQLLEETRFSLSEFEDRFNSLREANTQQSSLKDTFVLCFRRRFTDISETLPFGWKNAFSAFSPKGFKNFCKHTSVYLCKVNEHFEGRPFMFFHFGCRSRYFSIPRLLPFTLEYQNAAPRRNAHLTV